MSVARREDSLSIDDKEKIDRICNRFEEEFLAGRRPVMERFLRQIHPGGRPVLLGELLLLELDYRRSLDERLSPDDYLQRFPQMRDVIGAAFQSALERPVPVRFLPGAMIGRYEVRATLGTGAFAVVYLAWDGQLEREVAIKVPHRFLLSDDSERQRFLDEARTIARLRHPRIVALYDVAQLTDGTIYLVMQHVAGASLRQQLNQGPLLPQQASQIAAQVADALAAAHAAGVLHRDLKPGNILLDENSEPYVCDFGLALHVDNQRERQGEYAGTLTYMAPEQTRGEVHQLDGRADVWALGVIYYEMLTGAPPFEGCDRDELLDEILHRDPRPPRQLDPRIPRGQERVCLRCLAKQVGQRYATAGDVARALRTLRADQRSNWSWLLFSLTAATLWGAITAATLWFSARFDSKPTVLPLHATLDLLVWDAQRPDRQGVRVVEAGALPLRNGDRLRVSAQLDQPAYIYLLWLDVHGAVLPVYPWHDGHWDRRPSSEQPRYYLALPGKPDDGWMMKAEQDGLESLLLLARRSPLPGDVDLQRLLAAVSFPAPPSLSTAFVFQDGHPLPQEPPDTATLRPPDLDGAVRIRDPVLQMQRRIAEILRPHFELIRAVSFPVQGE